MVGEPWCKTRTWFGTRWVVNNSVVGQHWSCVINSHWHSSWFWCLHHPVWARGSQPSTLSLPHLLLYFFVSFTFPFFPFLLALSIFLLFYPFHSTRIIPLHFQAGCHRRRLNLLYSFWCVDIVFYDFLVKDACLFLLFWIEFCIAVW